MSFKAMAYATEQEITTTSPQSHLLLILASYANEFNECYPSITTMISKTRLSDKTVRKSLKDLIDLGLVVDTGKTSRFSTKIYKLVLKDNEETTPSKSTTPSKITTRKNSDTPSKFTTTPLVDLPPNPIIEPINNPIKKDISSSTPKKQKTKSASLEKPCDVSEQVWQDLLALRKAKKSPLSVSAWNIAKKQIEEVQAKTNHTLEQILLVWIERGWQGFKAEWYFNHINVQNSQGNQHASHQPVNPATHQQPVANHVSYGENLMAAIERRNQNAQSQSAFSDGHWGNVYDMESPV